MQKTFHPKYSRLLLVVLLHTLSLLSGAQHYPIQVNTIITPPYSGRLSDYAESGFDRVQMIINPLDLSLQSYKVKIKLIIESLDGRVRIQSDPNYLPPPVYLNGGVTEVITSYDLQEIFNVSHLIFMRGITKNEYLVKKRLPENYYRIGFVLLDYNHATMGGTSNEVIVSNFGYTQAGIFLNDPPILNLPNNQMRLPLYDPQHIVLQWTPRHRGSPNSAFSTEYVIRLYEVWNEGYSAAAIAQTQVPIYETTTTDTRYLYGISDPMLVPGNKYVWTVQARDADGRDMFRNDGLSEAYMFQWGEACKIPEAFTAVPLGGPAMELSWKTATGHTDYDIQYRTAGNAQWYEENSLLTNTRITNLAYSKSYETRIRANCGSYSSEYSLPLVIKMPEPPQQSFACGTAGMLVPVRSSAPLTALPSGAIFFAGGFECHVIEAHNENGGFTGSCYVVVPYYGFAKVLHNFRDIRINTDLQMLSGKLISVTDTVKGALLAQKIDEAGSNNNTGYSDEQLQANLEADTVVHINGRIDKITVDDEGNIVVILRNGDEEIIEVEEGKSVVISDKDGEQYYVDNGQVKTGDQALADKNTESTGEQVVADLNAARKALPLVYFSPSKNTQYGYDSLRFEELRRQYGVNTLLNKEYVIPYKAVASGKMDALDARIPEKSTFDGKGLSFRINETPAMAAGEKSSRLKTVNVAPLVNGDEQVLNAVYTLVDTAGNKAEEILGQVNIVAYDEQLVKLIIVPVGNKNYSEAAIRETINNIYRQSVTQWDIQWDKAFNWTLADSFDDTDKDNRMDYTSDMKALIREYKTQRDIDRQAVYVFLYSGSHVSALEGYMPFNKQFAFVFAKDNEDPAFIAKNISHEIAHGTFNLRHVFSDDNTYYQSSGTSNNLMDYKSDISAVELNKYQWDLIHNPESVMFSWLEDEEEAMIAEYYNWTNYFIEEIRCARYQKKSILDLEKWAKDLDGGVPQSVHLYDDVNYGSIGAKRKHGGVDKINIQSINVSGAIVSIGDKSNGEFDDKMRVEFTVRNSQLYESPELANKFKEYLTGDYNAQLSRTLVKLHRLPVESVVNELLGMSDCLMGVISAEWRFSFIERILNQNDNVTDNELFAFIKLLSTSIEPYEAEKLLLAIKEKGYDCQLINKVKKSNSSKYELLVMSLTKLFLAQSKTSILEYGKNVEAENFYIWQPLGNVLALWDAYNADPGLSTMWNLIHHTTYTYKVSYQTDCKFICDALASTGTMLGYSLPTSEYFQIKPLETVSVYFASKNEQLGIEDMTIAMPGIFFAWLIEQEEQKVTQAMKDVAILVASCYFPVANLSKALKARSYFSLAWNSLLLTKEVSDFMLNNDKFRSSMAYYLGSIFIEKYMKFSQLYDCTILFKDFANKEYYSVTVELIDQWNALSKDKKTELNNDFPEIYNKMNTQITKLQAEI